MSGKLFIVATPIGNLQDITLRGLQTLKEVDLILCEDTRVTRKLLDNFDIQAETKTYHQHTNDNKKQEILNLLIQGKNIALVTDAGTPGVSDPGNELIEFIMHTLPETPVVPIPGPSSLTAALSICGFNVSNFMMLGFWPKKKAKKLIDKVKLVNCPVIFFESPFRIIKTLETLEANFPESNIVIAQELTKLHERTLRGKISDVKSELEKEKVELGRVKGELVCILEA